MSSLPIANLLKQTVFVSSYAGDKNEFGDELYSAPVEYPARIEYAHHLVYGTDGTSYSSYATVYIAVDVPDKSKFFIPKYSGISVSDFPDYDETYIQGILDYMKFDTDIDYDDSRYREYVRLIHAHSKPAVSINHLHDGNGTFSHCEVSL